MALPSKMPPRFLRARSHASEKQRKRAARDFAKFLDAVRLMRPNLAISRVTMPALLQEFKEVYAARKETERLRKEGRSVLQKTKPGQASNMEPNQAFAELRALMKSSDYTIFTHRNIIFQETKRSLAGNLRKMAFKSTDARKQKELRTWAKTIDGMEVLVPNVFKYSHGRKNYLFIPDFWPTKKAIQDREMVTGTLYSAVKPIPLSYDMLSAKGLVTPIKFLVKIQEDVSPPKFIGQVIKMMVAHPLSK